MGTDCLWARRATRVAATLAIALAGAASIGSHAAAAEVTPALSERAADAAPGETIPVIAELRRQVDAEAFAGRPEALGRALRRTSARSRDDVSDAVGRPLRRFWLVNAVAGRLTPAEVGALAADPDVARVDWDRPVRLAQAGGGAGTAEENWGVVAIGASRVWSEMSLRGEGVVVGSIDTGVSASHPEVAGKVLAFRDFVNGRPDPYDDNGHGTHTLGTMIGAGARGGAIGVAPGARALVAKALGADGLGTGSQLLAAAQWMADPDGNPATQDQPAVVNSSWSASTANDPWFRKMIARWRELGIVPVFAAGNGGAAGLASPGGYPEVLATGAIDESGAIPDFSARRPVTWLDPDEAGPPTGTAIAKPDLVAPGVNVRSSYGAGYLPYSGTSMASAHAAGAAALVRQANPALGADATVEILRNTAQDAGPPGPDGDTGFGRLDAFAATQAAAGPAPETTLVHRPRPATGAATLTYGVTTDRGALVRHRVDRGAWSPLAAPGTVQVAATEGAHEVEFQAVVPAGSIDATPAAHSVTADRTAPKARIALRRSGARTTFVALAADELSGPRLAGSRWGFGRGRRAAGRLARVRFAEAGRRRVRLTVRDRAGNATTVSRHFTPRVVTPIRRLRVSGQISRRHARLKVRGRLVRRAAVRVRLRPLRGGLRPATVRPLDARPAGRSVARAKAPSHRGGFTVPIGLRRARPGLYRLGVRTAERGRRAGAPLVRAVRVTR